MAADDPALATLRAMMPPEALDGDGSLTIGTQGMAAILPLDDAPPSVYSVQGPVTSVARYGATLFDCEVWEVRVTIARIGADADVDLSILVSDVVLDGAPPPRVGDDVAAVIRLQGRILRPNIERGP